MSDKAPIDDWQKDINVIADTTRVNPYDGKHEQKWVNKLDITCRCCGNIGTLILEAQLPQRPKGIDLDVTRTPLKPEWEEIRPPKNWVEILVKPSMHYPIEIIRDIQKGKDPVLALYLYEQKHHRQWIEWSCPKVECASRIFYDQLSEAMTITNYFDGKVPLDIRWLNCKYYLKKAWRAIL